MNAQLQFLCLRCSSLSRWTNTLFFPNSRHKTWVLEESKGQRIMLPLAETVLSAVCIRECPPYK